MRPLLLLVLTFHCLLAQERFTDWHTELRLRTDRAIEVSETITVVAEGRAVQRGITRTLPAPVEVLQLLRDGSEESYHTDRRGGNVTIYAGEREVLLKPGRYTYHLRYRVPAAVERLGGVDELSFNVVGALTDFPVEQLRATVRLPENTTTVYTGCRTGASGTTGQEDCTIERPDSSTIRYTAGGTYGQGRVFTLAATFAPGSFVASAEKATTRGPAPEAAPWLRYLTVLILLLGAGAAYRYAVGSWRRYGVDPPAPDLAPVYAPPRDHAPAALGYLSGQGDGTARFTATLVGLSTLGYLEIDEEVKDRWYGKQSNYLLRRSAAAPPHELLTAEQREVFTGLFDERTEYRLKEEYDRELATIAERREKALRDQFHDYLSAGNNLRRVWPLVGILGGTLLALLLVVVLDPTHWLVPPVLFGIASLIALLVYALVIQQPTEDQVLLGAEINAFERYLGMSERKRKALPGAPEMTVEHYEELLPYAIALGIHTKWTGYFADLLTPDAAVTTYPRGRAFRAAGFTTAFSSSVATGTQVADGGGGSFSGGGGSAGGGSSGGGGAGGW